MRTSFRVFEFLPVSVLGFPLCVSTLLGCAAAPPPPAPQLALASDEAAVQPSGWETAHKRPSESIASATVVAPLPTERRVIGYFTNWGHTRPAPCEFKTSDVPAALLTHINYAFASVTASEDKDTFELGPSSPEDVSRLYAEVNALKKGQPNLRTLLSVGGWAFNDEPTAWIFSAMASSAERRGHFIRQATNFLRAHGFDGLDIDWEFPGAAERGGKPEDAANFTSLLREFRAHFHAEALHTGQREFLLTIASPAGQYFYQHQQLSLIHEPLDWINVMTYDYHGDWDKKIGDNAPLVDSGRDVEETVAAYVALGVPRTKIVMGLPTYARGFGGVKKDEKGASAPLTGPDSPCGKDSLSSHHVQAWIQAGRYARVWDAMTQTPHAYDKKNGFWISYDDEISYTKKLEFLERERLGGGMFWAIDQDDVKNGFPLIRQVSKQLLGTSVPQK